MPAFPGRIRALSAGAPWQDGSDPGRARRRRAGATSAPSQTLLEATRSPRTSGERAHFGRAWVVREGERAHFGRAWVVREGEHAHFGESRRALLGECPCQVFQRMTAADSFS